MLSSSIKQLGRLSLNHLNDWLNQVDVIKTRARLEVLIFVVSPGTMRALMRSFLYEFAGSGSILRIRDHRVRGLPEPFPC